jgi:hypothetical protein
MGTLTKYKDRYLKISKYQRSRKNTSSSRELRASKKHMEHIRDSRKDASKVCLRQKKENAPSTKSR